MSKLNINSLLLPTKTISDTIDGDCKIIVNKNETLKNLDSSLNGCTVLIINSSNNKITIYNQENKKLLDIQKNNYRELIYNNGWITDNSSIENEGFKNILLDYCYPIGSLYWSSKSTNPKDLFGGVWKEIKDKFVWAKGDTDIIDATYGSKTKTLNVNNIPSHEHDYSFDLSHAHNLYVGAYGKSFYHNGGPQHPATYTWGTDESNKNPGNKVAVGDSSLSGASELEVKKWGGNQLGFTVPSSSNATTYGSNLATYVTNTEVTSCQVSSKTETTGNTAAFDIMPPYVVKYCWERTE